MLYKVTARKKTGAGKRSMHTVQDPEVKERCQREAARRLESVPQALLAGSIEAARV